MRAKRHLSFLLILAAVLTLLPAAALSAAAEGVAYLPGVTKEMTDPAYWTAGMADPDALLATAEEIAGINAAALGTEGANMHDLRRLPETFDGLARCEALRKSAAADAAYYLGWTWDETGKKLEQADFDPILANCADPDATAEMPLRYGVAVNRTVLTAFPDGADVAYWASEAMQWAVDVGLVLGKADGTLDAQGAATHAELAAVLQRRAALTASAPETPAA